MAFTLFYHPLSSYCWKVLIALYESKAEFELRQVNLFEPADKAEFRKVWPLAKLPVLVDTQRGETIPESTLIIEYLARHVPGAAALLPADPEAARPILLRDRVIDNYIHLPFFQVVGERLRPPGNKDPFGVERNKEAISGGYDQFAGMIAGPWTMGEAFTLADCSAFPALYYADYAVSLAGWPGLAAYLERLKTRPSIARVLSEAEPWFQYFPLKDG